jgi:hypothetical protein
MVFDKKTRRSCSPLKENKTAVVVAVTPNKKTPSAITSNRYRDIDHCNEPKFNYDHFRDLISPYDLQIKKMGFENIIETALLRVIDFYGDNPSILPATEIDGEANELAGYRDLYNIFHNIPLTDHAYYILKNTLKIMNFKYSSESFGFSPWLIALSLSMDIGVAKQFRTNMPGNKTDHTVISADLFMDLVLSNKPDYSRKGMEPFMDAIRNHHVPPVYNEGMFSSIIRTASTLARQHEVVISTNFKDTYFGNWFKPEIVIDALKKSMNYGHTPMQ